MRKTFFLYLLLLPLTLYGQNAERHIFENGLPYFLDSLQNEMTYPMAWGNSDIRDFDMWRTKARALLIDEMLTPPRPATDYNMRITAEERRDGYRALRVELDITAYSRVTAYMLIPDGKGPHPTVLLLHDHGGHFTIGKEKMIRPFGVADSIAADADAWCRKCYGGQYVGDWLARHGYLVFATDAPFWGERGVKGGTRWDDYKYIAGNYMMLGRNLSSWMNFEDVYAAEFLATLKEVDSSRIACMGFSMGAYRAWMVSALTDRVRCGAAVCWMHTTRYQLNREYGLKRHEEWANLIPGIRRYMDYPHIASIACPKPMLFINGKTDHLFPPISVSDAFNTMHSVWDSQNAGTALETEIWDMGHYCGPEVQQRVLKFLDKNLQSGQSGHSGTSGTSGRPGRPG